MRRNRPRERPLRSASSGSVTSCGSHANGPPVGVSSSVTLLQSPFGRDEQADGCHASRSESDFELDVAGALPVEHLCGVVQLRYGCADRVMKHGADGRPVLVNAPDSTRSENPRRIGVRVLQNVEGFVR
jgi:hypothetical protein